MFGIDAFTPILNLPQAAILGIGRIIEESVVRDRRLEVGLTLTLSLTFDHRILDGAPAARFLQAIANPSAALLNGNSCLEGLSEAPS
jgi:pyruvate dehydrogenase E2 component (dihydrolipoamide acetyltransferase)